MNWKPATAALLGALVVSCAIDDPIDPDALDLPDPVATLLAPVSGGGQTGGAGVELAAPLRVRVLDQFGAPVEDATVVWSVAGGGGSLAPAVSSTNADGIASTEWTLGATLGEQTVQAVTEPATTTAVFTATAVAGPPAAIQLAPDTLFFDALGDTARVAIAAQDAFGNAIAAPRVAWTSDHLNRATVSGSGLVTATGNGTTRVIASSSDAADTVVVVVSQVPTQVVVTPAADTLIGAGDSTRLQARAYDANGRAIAGAAIAWSSSATAVATVSSTGIVRAVDAGTTTVTATHGAAAGTATVVVRIPAALVIAPAADSIFTLGDTVRLRAYALDAGGDTIRGAAAAWTSLDTLIARVDRYGRVTARDTGSARIVATLGALSDTALVDVAPDTSTSAPARTAQAPRRGNGTLRANAAGAGDQPARVTRRVASRHAERGRARSRG